MFCLLCVILYKIIFLIIIIVEVAVIDEIQLLRDPTRGWAWTRALLGLAADEIHLCGEYGALSIVSFTILLYELHINIKKFVQMF